MSTFGDLQNGLLQRCRQSGANWGGTPTNTGTSLLNPYRVQLELNQAYNRVLAVVKDFPIATVEVSFPTVANTTRISINPCPNTALGAANPSLLQVYEYKYTQAAGQIRYIPFVSDTKYRQYTAGYNQVLSSFSAFPDVLRQTFGLRVIDAFPGYGTSGDTITITGCPDPIATGTTLPCANGGLMVAVGDVPILPAEFHPVILAGAVMAVAPDLDKEQIFNDAQKVWDAFVQEMEDFGSTVAEGDAQQIVIDTWSSYISPELSVM